LAAQLWQAARTKENQGRGQDQQQLRIAYGIKNQDKHGVAFRRFDAAPMKIDCSAVRNRQYRTGGERVAQVTKLR
jgi:hypothetical protein